MNAQSLTYINEPQSNSMFVVFIIPNPSMRNYVESLFCEITTLRSEFLLEFAKSLSCKFIRRKDLISNMSGGGTKALT